jgi:hypothetical protein
MAEKKDAEITLGQKEVQEGVASGSQTTPKPKIEIDADEYTKMIEDSKRKDRVIAAYKMREKNPKVTGKPSAPEIKPTEPHEHRENEIETTTPTPGPGKPHYVGTWQQYCPDCGDKNPEFKDETECPDCHMHLGAKDQVEKLKACPNCGGHKAVEL